VAFETSLLTNTRPQADAVTFRGQGRTAAVLEYLADAVAKRFAADKLFQVHRPD
jgi:hypothetical protein